MRPRIKRILTAAIIAVFGFQTTSCGYILHPERKGQRSGKIDAGIAVLDGVGLLLFLIPGIVAFAVDFHFGTIYLPSGKRKAEADGTEGAPLKTVKFEGDLTADELEAILARETGSSVDLDRAEIHLARASSPEQIRALLNKAETSGG